MSRGWWGGVTARTELSVEFRHGGVLSGRQCAEK